MAQALPLTEPHAVTAPVAATGETCTIWGTSGKDKLVGTPGDDVLCGLGGNDTILGGDGNDVIDGGPGSDILKGGSGDDILIGGSGNDAFDGQTGTDTASYAASKTSVTVNLTSHKKQKTGQGTDTLVRVENLTGGSGKDTLNGDTHANTIDGGPGNDRIKGGSGNDTLIGGPGNDRLDGQSGSDRVSYAGSSVGITANLALTGAQSTGEGTDTLLSDENLTGGDGDDTLTGNGAANDLDGGAGDDTLTGAAGNDTLTGDEGDDTLTGGDGDDTIDGGPNPDNLDGGSGANLCTYDAEDTVAPNCDSTAPQVVGLSLSSDTVDTADADQVITVTVHLTDDLAGMRDGFVSFRNPNSQRTLGFYIFTPPNPFSTLVSGDALDGVYSGTLTVPQGSAKGTWSATVDINDTVGNRLVAGPDALAAAGLPASFTQAGAPTDSGAPPQLVGLEVSPTSIDASASDQQVVITAHVTDDVAVQSVDVGIGTPTGADRGLTMTASDRVSGDAKDGVYQAAFTVPRYAAQGYWRIDSVEMTDTSGNRGMVGNLAALGLPDGFTQTGEADAAVPELASLSIEPATVHTADSDQTITITARVTDDLSGFKVGSAIFRSEALADQSIISYFSDYHRVDGTLTDGTYQWTVVVPRYSATGAWDLVLSLNDNAGNTVYLHADDLDQLGFPSGFTVG